ncbi:MAG: polysaccharide deacetylase family protein [Granulicella sp.]
MAGNFQRRQNGLILTLHRVLPLAECQDAYDEHMVLSTTAFEDLLIYLKNNFEIVSLNHLLSDRNSSTNVQKIALTFDDGWRDTFQHAFPLLVKHQVPATVFICSSLVGSSAMLPEERFTRIYDLCTAKHCIPSFLQHLGTWGKADRQSESSDWRSFTKTIPMTAKLSLARHLEIVYGMERAPAEQLMTWKEVKTMAAGGIEIGSHTANHATLNVESRAVIERELWDSRDLIAAKLGASPRYLSYPNGAYNQSVMLLAHEAGYSHAFTTKHGGVDQTMEAMAVPRVAIDNTVLTNEAGRLHVARTALHLSPLWHLFTALRS